jgi:antitoxin HicB
MNGPLRYSMVVQWSAADDAYLVTLPELEGRVFGTVTHGEIYEEAVKNGTEVLELLIEAARESGEILPEPRVVITSAG